MPGVYVNDYILFAKTVNQDTLARTSRMPTITTACVQLHAQARHKTEAVRLAGSAAEVRAL